jgi:hypothetical protein
MERALPELFLRCSVNYSSGEFLWMRFTKFALFKINFSTGLANIFFWCAFICFRQGKFRRLMAISFFLQWMNDRAL